MLIERQADFHIFPANKHSLSNMRCSFFFLLFGVKPWLYALLAHKELVSLAGEHGHEILYGVISVTIEMHTSNNEGKKGQRNYDTTTGSTKEMIKLNLQEWVGLYENILGRANNLNQMKATSIILLGSPWNTSNLIELTHGAEEK